MQVDTPQTAQDNLNIVFTSLHGTSITIVPDTLSQAGYTNVTIVPEQAVPRRKFSNGEIA
jgi:phosphomannomutase